MDRTGLTFRLISTAIQWKMPADIAETFSADEFTIWLVDPVLLTSMSGVQKHVLGNSPLQVETTAKKQEHATITNLW